MPGTNLTRDEAARRAQLVRVHDYRIDLDLSLRASTFATTVTVTFSCTEPGADTFIDFVGESVDHVRLNGQDLDPVEVADDARITLSNLDAHNELTIAATGRYMNTGEGLHRFVDPVDEQVYLYTQFEVADSRRMFPVFEQPDLKATFQFTVTAPRDWRIISNQPSPTPQALDGDLARWHFSPTPVISSYITALIAGPYQGLTQDIEVDGKVIPLGVYCRRSLAPYLQAQEMLEVTRAGFEFFSAQFGQPYPFEKYDQVFCPEYNMGAMENAGAVTFNEVYLFRAKVPDALVERRALTILHELAHMWFGDLVTMAWWDDLWLNESFAEWASTTAQAEATRWTNAWTTFAIAEKAWAYSQDQLSSTHPIAADIRHLEDVQVNFDGITYAKGASVLKQLVAFVGRDAFVAGLRSYFTRYAWGNTRLADLLAELEATSGRDLVSWSRLWLETAGVNTIRAIVTTHEGGRITEAYLEQTAPHTHPTLRPHRIGIGRYDVRAAPEGGQVLARTGYLEVDVEGDRTPVPELTGLPHPDLLLVNDEDLAYTKIRLDERSLATALDHLCDLQDSLPRALVLGAAWDMTRDAEMPGRDFVDLVVRALSIETDSTLLRTLLAQLRTTTTMYVAASARTQTVAAVTAALRDLAETAEPGTDRQLQLVGAFALFAADPHDLAWLRGLLDGEVVLEGLVLDTEMRWTLLTGLAAGGMADETAIAAEAERDNTATGRERAARALAARPSAAAKEQAWHDAVDSIGLPNQTLDALWQGFGRVHDPALLAPYVSRYHESLRQIWESRTHAIAGSLVEGFYPVRLADETLLTATQSWLDANTDAPDGLIRLVSENRDVVRRALAAQARDERRVG
ncbi:MAG: aminopeptidase N [Austwickia sp.]|nr:aminopeptidase N [Austwickia sp.]MBK8434964.1 aminopeptidase N [Austwickia sp.]MBK9101478.1 aminopeptidase N [Austwickia sp.]